MSSRDNGISRARARAHVHLFARSVAGLRAEPTYLFIKPEGVRVVVLERKRTLCSC